MAACSSVPSQPLGIDADGDGLVELDDCDDSDASVLGQSVWHADADRDGYGAITVTLSACVDPGDGWVDDANDCDDADAAINPAADEVCDGLDNDCDFVFDGDTAVDAATWYPDGDGDGFGQLTGMVMACDAPVGCVAFSGDCNDNRFTDNPGADELCDLRDNDCDGETDVGAVDAAIWYFDNDGDGVGGDTVLVACVGPVGWVAEGLDCDDEDETVGGAPTWYTDADADGYGDAATPLVACDGTGRIAQGGDCADDDPEVFPGSHLLEVPGDGIDADCDGLDACTDLNCDGWPDLVFIQEYDSDGSSVETVSHVVYGQDWTVSAADELPGLAQLAAAVSDYDSDGYLDVAVSGWRDADLTADPPTWIYYGSAAGYSDTDRGSLPTGAVSDLCADDLDLDGHADLLVVNSSLAGEFETSSIYWGSPTGLDATDAIPLGIDGAQGCATGDVNGDGLPDIALAVPFTDGPVYQTNSWYVESTSAGFGVTPPTAVATEQATRAFIVDLDADGRDDLVFNSLGISDTNPLGTAKWSWGFAGGLTATPYGVQVRRAADLALDDLDQDGQLDFVFGRDDVLGGADVFLSTDSWVDVGRIHLPGVETRSVATADFDGDGHVDVLVPAHNQGGVLNAISRIYPGSAAGPDPATSIDILTSGPGPVVVADLNLDGLVDIVMGCNEGPAWSESCETRLYWGQVDGSWDTWTALELSGVAAIEVVGG